MKTLHIQTWIKQACTNIFGTLHTNDAIFVGSIRTKIDAKKEAYIILAYALSLNPIFLRTHDQVTISTQQEAFLQECLTRRISGEPIALIVGKKEFYSIDFIVNEHTLIPRTETELLVDETLLYGDKNSVCQFIDIGCGSGCIGLSILSHRPHWHGTFVDINPETLNTAQKNADSLALNSQCNFILADFTNETFLDAVIKQYSNPSKNTLQHFQLVISNPPYIPPHEYTQLHHEVKHFEPKKALISEIPKKSTHVNDLANYPAKDDGLYHITHIINVAKKLLHPNGILIMEHGYNQAAFCKELCSNNAWYNVQSKKDYANIERYIIASRSH